MGDRVRRLQREGAGWSVCVPRTNKENDNNRWLLEQQSNKKRAGPEDDDILAERRTEGKGATSCCLYGVLFCKLQRDLCKEIRGLNEIGAFGRWRDASSWQIRAGMWMVSPLWAYRE